MSAPKEMPILFSAPMVRALLAGTKTQTRRVVSKPDPKSYGGFKEMDGEVMIYNETNPTTGLNVREYAFVLNCPFQPGDVLWVREEHYAFGHWEPVEGVRTKKGRQKWKFVRAHDGIFFDADHVPGGSWRLGRHHKDPFTKAWHKRLGRFMPRAFARITLRVKSVRVERLQDISEEDSIAEGIQCLDERSGLYRYYTEPFAESPEDDPRRGMTNEPVLSYESLWTSINGPGSWEANPFVWVVTFERMEGGAAV